MRYECVANRTQLGQLGHAIFWIFLYDFVLYMPSKSSKVELSVARGVLALDEPTSGQPPNIRAESRSKMLKAQTCILYNYFVSCLRHSGYNWFSVSMYFMFLLTQASTAKQRPPWDTC